MPTVRIRTHDPESVSFFTSKLADCGFDVEFAAPGQRVRGEVDLEITVNYSKKTAPRKQLRNTATPVARIEWTTPYHVDAPELEDELKGEVAGKRDVSRDRALARILTGASNHDDMFVVGEQEQVEQQVLATPEAPIEISVTPQPVVAISRPPLIPPRENKRPTVKRAPIVRRSFLQRNAASVSAIILATAVVIFYLSFFGASSSAAQPSTQTSIPAPATAPPAPATDVATTSAPSTETSSDGDSTDSAAPHKSSTRRHHRAHTAQKVSSQSDEPEVTVRHFLTWPDKEAAKPRANE